jgi:uncharacterized protein (TIGR00375 family)
MTIFISSHKESIIFSMTFVADLHVHSRFSRATSPEMNPAGLWRWAQLKGISVIGTGDFTHPDYLNELRNMLEPADGGLYQLRDKFKNGGVPDSCRAPVKFMFQAEVSSIYSKNDRTRKVHSIIFAPDFETVEEINRRLDAIGNLKSDGRPILGLDAKRLLEIVLECSDQAMVVPAHAWTPHFSVFGAASGFDSLEECYEDLTPYIYAIETGLSSDPPMNRLLSALDNITLISNSDAHSPSKLGREGNVFECGQTYGDMMHAMKTRDGFKGTIEFFPEEGKYHLDGHRNCGVSMMPDETVEHGFLCPVCGRKLTVGVMHRVAALADRKRPVKSTYYSIIPLDEMIAEVMGRGVNTKGVKTVYFDMLRELGNEFFILMEAPLADIERAGDEKGEKLAEAVGLMRKGEVTIEPGYDGQYGSISVFDRKEARKKNAKKKARAAGKRKAQQGLF